MRVLIAGHNVSKALKICKSLTLDKPVLIARDLCLGPDTDTDFPGKMKKFLTICKQGYHPGKINFYQYSPWSQKGLWQDTNTKSEQETLDQYHHVIGWNPDMVIYLFDVHSSRIDKLVYDTDNRDDVKIWKLNANEKQLKANLMMILDNDRLD